jgi:hypothetical protein
MVSFTVKMSAQLFRELRTAVGMHVMSGAAYGLADSFMARLVHEIDAGKTEHLFQRKA